MKKVDALEKIVFYGEWLPLPKEEFNILTMLAEQGGSFSGNLTDMCRYFGLSQQQKNRATFRSAIESLTANGYITSEVEGRTYHLKLVPKANEIKIFKRLVQSAVAHNYTSEPVSPASVIKVMLWIIRNQKPVVTNREIAHDTKLSESTICSAKNVLQKEYEAIRKRRVSTKVGENYFITLGQELQSGAWFTPI